MIRQTMSSSKSRRANLARQMRAAPPDSKTKQRAGSSRDQHVTRHGRRTEIVISVRRSSVRTSRESVEHDKGAIAVILATTSVLGCACIGMFYSMRTSYSTKETEKTYEFGVLGSCCLESTNHVLVTCE